MSVIEREATESPVTGESGCLVRPVTTSDVLHRAADLIGEHGHLKGDIGKKGAGFCAVGAVLEAVADFGSPKEVAAWDALELIGGADVICWNNAPERTSAEVVARLREAADA